MKNDQTIDAINLRYSELAETTCCLSCGGAVKYSSPQEGEICLDLGSGRGLDMIRMAEEVGPSGHAFGVLVDHRRGSRVEAGLVEAGGGRVVFDAFDGRSPPPAATPIYPESLNEERRCGRVEVRDLLFHERIETELESEPRQTRVVVASSDIIRAAVDDAV